VPSMRTFRHTAVMTEDDAFIAEGSPQDHPRAERPNIHEVIGRAPTALGDVLVLLTDNPLPEQPNFHTYAALADWMPIGSPVVMFVVVRKFESRHEVGMVYAAHSVRGPVEPGGSHNSVAVQLGRWLFQKGAFTHHSVDRTPSGDRWARLVGGVVPPLPAANDCHRATSADVVRQAELAYSALCAKDWSPWLTLGQ
jgi:hypothetical protein